MDSLTKIADQLSTLELALWCSGSLVALTWIEIVCLKPLRRTLIHREPNFNTLVNYSTGSFGLCYGLLLSLLAVATYQNSARVQASVDNEAAAVAALYEAAGSYPQPLGAELQYLIRDYTLYVILKDWPAHRNRQIWSGGTLRLEAIQNNIIAFHPASRMQELLQQQSLSAMSALRDARQQRLTGVRTSIPIVLWYVVGIGLLVHTLLFSMLDTGVLIHMLLGAIISSFLGVLIFLILAMDRPLQGAVSVSPEAYVVTYDLFMRPDETNDDASGFTAQQRYFISVGTGPVSGLYYSIGRSICQSGAHAFASLGIYCSVEPTLGSSYNVGRLAAGELDFAFVQSDIQFEASTGKGPWSGKRVGSLRAVMSLYPELITILARPGTNLNGPESLSGKRVNVGPPGSGTRASWEELEPSLGLTKDKLGLIMEIPSESATPLLCSNQLDASIWIIGHPSKLINEQLHTCDLGVSGVTGPIVDKVISARPYLVKGIIPGRSYGLPGDISSFGVQATIVTTERVPAEVVHDFTRAILTNLKELQRSQPALAGIRAEAMVHSGMTAPVHPGAAKAFQEVGLMN